MRLSSKCTALVLIICLLIFSVPAAAFGQGKTTEAATDRILVEFKDQVDTDTKKKTHIRYGVQLNNEINQLGVHVVQVPAGKVNEKLRAYKKDKNVSFAEPDYVAKAYFTPNDPYFSREWALPKIKATEAWNITQSNPGIKIAILDTGIDLSHRDLASKIVASINFTGSNTADDIFGHGTHVAGIAAAVVNNGLGVSGIGYNSSIMNVKVLGDNGSGYTSAIAKGIIWAADNGAKVINLSLGSPSSSATLEKAVNYAWGKGVVIVAAAGNDGANIRNYPAAYKKVIAVAATDQNDNKAGFSNYGYWVHVAAPGVDIFSTLPDHKNNIGASNYGSLSGTSMASPYVAGLAGLTWSTKYGTDNTSVRKRIEKFADATGSIYSANKIKRINALKAVSP